MPGYKKQTQGARIAVAVCWCLVLGSLCTHSASEAAPASYDTKAMPDVIVADGTGILPEEGAFTSTPMPENSTKSSASEEKNHQPPPTEEDQETPSGTWILSEGEWYYLNDGVYKTGWLYENQHWYYFGEDGKMQIGWVLDQEHWYFTDEDGIMQTGWTEVDGKWYYLNEDGVMQVGWLLLEDQWYYLNESGDMQIGWLSLGEDWYYLNANGTMATGWIVVNGSHYFLKENGVWDASKSPDTAKNQDTAQGAKIALTFDGGPGLYTERLLNTLEKCNAKATFFIDGEKISDYPQTIGRINDMGCELGHMLSFSTDLTDSQIHEKLTASDTSISEITGQAANLARPLETTDGDPQQKSIEKPLILWTIDTKDNETSDINAILDTVLSTVQEGDIIRLHDIYEPSVTAVEILLPVLQERGYELVTVSELAASKNVFLKQGNLYEKL